MTKTGFMALVVAGAIASLRPSTLPAQDTRRAEATRAELQASLAELEQYVASSGYSGRLRDQKRREAALIRERLDLGDIQVGDSVELAVVGEPSYTGAFPVVAGRVISLPGLPDIPLKGVLRSEARDYLTGKLAKYIRDPQVRVRTTIRLSVFGSVARPGFYQVPADALATDVFMKAGLSQDADPNKAFIRRGDEVIWPADSFRDAMQKGLTLDQLNLRAGDELVFDPRKRAGGISVYGVLGIITAVTSLTYLGVQIFHHH